MDPSWESIHPPHNLWRKASLLPIRKLVRTQLDHYLFRWTNRRTFPETKHLFSGSTGGWTQQTASFFFRKWSAPNFRTTITVVKTHLMLTIPTYYHSFSYYHTAHIELDDNHLVKQKIQNPAVSIWIKIINPSQKENHSDGAACLFPIISNE